MKHLSVISFPRSGQSVIVNSLFCLDPIWTDEKTGQAFLLFPMDGCFPNKEVNAREYFVPNGKKYDGIIRFDRSHALPCADVPFIHVVRDPRDIICSYARCAVYQHNAEYENALRHFINGSNHVVYPNTADMNTLMKFCADAERHQFHVGTIRYEDLIISPLGICQELFKKAGWITEKKTDYPDFGKLCELSPWYYKRGKSGVWKTEMPAEIAERASEKYAPMIERYGYS